MVAILVDVIRSLVVLSMIAFVVLGALAGLACLFLVRVP